MFNFTAAIFFLTELFSRHYSELYVFISVFYLGKLVIPTCVEGFSSDLKIYFYYSCNINS